MTEPENEAAARTRRRGRIALVAGLVAAAAIVLAPSLLRRHLEADLCPTDIVRRGTSDGAAWHVGRSDCGAGRIVWQLRIVPQKGVSTLVYEAAGGPAPLSWRQSGFVGEVALETPLTDGRDRLAVDLDIKGRPTAPIRVEAGRLP